MIRYEVFFSIATMIVCIGIYITQADLKRYYQDIVNPTEWKTVDIVDEKMAFAEMLKDTTLWRSLEQLLIAAATVVIVITVGWRTHQYYKKMLESDLHMELVQELREIDERLKNLEAKVKNAVMNMSTTAQLEYSRGDSEIQSARDAFQQIMTENEDKSCLTDQPNHYPPSVRETKVMAVEEDLKSGPIVCIKTSETTVTNIIGAELEKSPESNMTCEAELTTGTENNFGMCPQNIQLDNFHSLQSPVSMISESSQTWDMEKGGMIKCEVQADTQKYQNPMYQNKVGNSQTEKPNHYSPSVTGTKSVAIEDEPKSESMKGEVTAETEYEVEECLLKVNLNNFDSMEDSVSTISECFKAQQRAIGGAGEFEIKADTQKFLNPLYQSEQEYMINDQFWTSQELHKISDQEMREEKMLPPTRVLEPVKMVAEVTKLSRPQTAKKHGPSTNNNGRRKQRNS